jgi:hypothetical protein
MMGRLASGSNAKARAVSCGLLALFAVVGCGRGRGSSDAGEVAAEAPEDGAGGAPDDAVSAHDDSIDDAATFDVEAGDDVPEPASDVSPSALAVTPNRVSARGGTVVEITGATFSAPVVTIDGEAAEVVTVGPGSLRVRTPRLVAGPAELRLKDPGVAAVVLPGALVVEPLTLAFAPADAELEWPVGTAEVRAAAPLDTDLDGDLDLVVATEDGLRILANDGQGHFAPLVITTDTGTAPVRPGGAGDVRGLATGDFDGDGDGEVIACTAAGRDLRFRGSTLGLVELGGPPLRGGACHAVVTTDANRDGKPDLAALIDLPGGTRGVSVFLNQGGGVFTEATSLMAPSESVAAVGTASSLDPASGLAFSRTREQAAQGSASARLDVAVSATGPKAVFALEAPLSEVPDQLHLAIRGNTAALTARLRVVTDGGVLDGPALPLAGPGWTVIDTPPLSTWTNGGQAPLGALGALSEFVVVVESAGGLPASGTLYLDAVWASRAGQMPILLADFEDRSATWPTPGAEGLVSGDMDGDGNGDLLVLGPAPTWLLTRGAPSRAAESGPHFRSATINAGAPGPFSAGLTVDADGDGDLDLALAAETQDRLLLGDGWGKFIDTTVGALPVDWSVGRVIATADMDRDGHPDLLIGNHGATDRLYVGLGDGRFQDATPTLGFDTLSTGILVVADVDGDGGDDVVSLAGSGATAPYVRLAVAP